MTTTYISAAFWLAISIGPVIGLYVWVAHDARRALEEQGGEDVL